MRILFYIKSQDRYVEGDITEAKVKRDDETYTIYGDNLKYIRVPGKCMACGKSDDWKGWEMITGLFIWLIGASIVAIAVTHIYSAFFK